MRQFMSITILLLPLITGCSEDEFQSQFAGYPTSNTQSEHPYKEESSVGVSAPELTNLGQGD